MKKYNEMTIDELHAQMRQIKEVIRSKDRESAHGLEERSRFRKMFVESIKHFRNTLSIETITEFYFDCNSLGYAVYPTKAELVDLINQGFKDEETGA